MAPQAGVGRGGGSWCLLRAAGSRGEPRTKLFPLKTSFCPKLQLERRGKGISGAHNQLTMDT